jgi:adenosylhomocysteine nucleosidase
MRRKLAIAGALVLLGALAWRPVWRRVGRCEVATEVAPTALDAVPRLLVMTAHDPEFEQIRAGTRIAGTHAVNGNACFTGELAGNEVVIARSGVSMVNAAMTTQALLDRFHVTGIVLSGIAGGVDPSLAIGDVVVPAQWAQYQEHAFARQTADGWDTGWNTTTFGNFGMMFPQKVFVTRRHATLDAREMRFWFTADPAMVRVAREVAGRIALARCSVLGCLDGTPRVVVGGNGVSGPTFVDNAEYREWVGANFHAVALDMETAAVAHVAYTNEVPFVAFRSLSDLAGGGAGRNEIVRFFQIAARNSATVVVAFLEAWRTHRDAGPGSPSGAMLGP